MMMVQRWTTAAAAVSVAITFMDAREMKNAIADCFHEKKRALLRVLINCFWCFEYEILCEIYILSILTLYGL